MCGLWGSCGPAESVPPSSPCSAGPSCGPVCSWESGQPASPDTETGCTRSPDRKNTNLHEDTVQNKDYRNRVTEIYIDPPTVSLLTQNDH